MSQAAVQTNSNCDTNEVGDDDDLMLPSVLLQLYIPRTTYKQRVSQITSNTFSLTLQAGNFVEGFGSIPQTLPIGSNPRIALSYITSYALKHRTLEVNIGRSATDFLRLMGVSSDSRKYKNLHAQMQALAGLSVLLTQNGRTRTIRPIDQLEAWPQRGRLVSHDRVLKLNAEFYDELISKTTLLDAVAMDKMSESTLALDFYVYMKNMPHSSDNQSVMVKWTSLRRQFYPSGGMTMPIRELVKSALGEVKRVCPNMSYTIRPYGVEFHPASD